MCVCVHVCVSWCTLQVWIRFAVTHNVYMYMYTHAHLYSIERGILEATETVAYVGTNIPKLIQSLLNTSRYGMVARRGE